MPVTVNINGLSAVHQGSNGVAMATVPDVCNTPSAGGPIPIPYPNIAMSSDLVSGTTTVMIDGCSAAIQGCKFIKSTGDEAGVAGGVASGVFAMEATFLSFSPTVTLDGQPACRLTDKMLMNKGNMVCMAGELQSIVPPSTPDSSSADDVIMSASPETPKHCVLRSVLVQCGHSKRNVQLDLAKHDVQILQVISKANEPDKLIVEWDGDCGNQHSFCPTVGTEYKKEWKVIDRATGKVELPAPSWIMVRDWAWIFKVLAMQKNITRDYYTLKSRLCMGHDQSDVDAGQWLQVQVFPEAEWKAEMSIAYSHKNAKDSQGKDDPFAYDANSTWTIEFSGDAKFGSNSFKCSLEAKQLADGLPLFGSLLEKVGWCTKVFDSMASFGADITTKLRWPKWTFGGGLKLVSCLANHWSVRREASNSVSIRCSESLLKSASSTGSSASLVAWPGHPVPSWRRRWFRCENDLPKGLGTRNRSPRLHWTSISCCRWAATSRAHSAANMWMARATSTPMRHRSMPAST